MTAAVRRSDLLAAAQHEKEPTMTETCQGWAWPSNARKAHYYDTEGRTLCRRWFSFAPRFLASGAPDPAVRCKACDQRAAA